MFLESHDGWWFLDTVEGTLERRWSSMDDMFADLEGEDGRAEYLLEETLNTALNQGMRLGDDEVFAFLPPPAVTGTMSVNSLAPLRFAIAANLAGRIHGELNGVQPDAGASALFAAQNQFAQNQAAQNQAAQNQAAHSLAGPTPSFDSPNPPADLWQPAAQQVNTGAYPSYQPAADAGAHTGGQPGYGTGYQPQYAAGSELDYGSGQQAYGSGSYPGAPTAQATYAAPTGTHTAGVAAPAAAPAAPGGYGSQGSYNEYDYEDNAHTLDSGQFSQYIADQYNTGQMTAVEYDASAPAQRKPRQDGRWSYA
ncbi:hypothetical protein [Promicromonospora sp. NPDC090134]|uniref:hypothetical protein n=1 Tax=Promicromonospora sp. NPDC090134 TaxID=3364408 RepID=UPI003828EF41